MSNFTVAHILSQVMQANNKGVSKVAQKLIESFRNETVYQSEMGVDFGTVISQCAAGLNTETTIFSAKAMVKYFAIQAADHEQQVIDRARLMARFA